MALRLGIGVATFNRRGVLAEVLDRIARHTTYPDTRLVVADDGSRDGTREMLRERQIPLVSGQNMGVAWNKNRALFLLSELLRCDIVILLEDDVFPVADGWERDWIQAALRWGHANLAGAWMQRAFVSGHGSLDDPVRSTETTAQCQVFSREALLFGGYFDPRFRGYGHEHVEHSRRMVRAGYGGSEETLPDGSRRVLFTLLSGALGFLEAGSSFDREQADRNLLLARSLFFVKNYRAPWRNEAEMQQFRDEMRLAEPRVL